MWAGRGAALRGSREATAEAAAASEGRLRDARERAAAQQRDREARDASLKARTHRVWGQGLPCYASSNGTPTCNAAQCHSLDCACITEARQVMSGWIPRAAVSHYASSIPDAAGCSKWLYQTMQHLQGFLPCVSAEQKTTWSR